MKRRNGWVLLWLELRRVAAHQLIRLAEFCLPKNEDDAKTLVAFLNLYAAMINDASAQMQRRKQEREIENGKR